MSYTDKMLYAAQSHSMLVHSVHEHTVMVLVKAARFFRSSELQRLSPIHMVEAAGNGV